MVGESLTPDHGVPEAAPPRKVCLAPLPPGVKAKANTPKLLRRDLRTLVLFVRTYCHGKHKLREDLLFKGFDLTGVHDKPLFLCQDCCKLLMHALVKRQHCPRDPKPACKHCPTHCYHKAYRAQIREVMKFSGRRLLLRGRLDYLFHLFF